MMIRPRRRAAQQRRGRERAHSLGSILSRAYAAPVLQPPQQARLSPRIAAASKRPKGCLTLGKSTAVAAAAVAVAVAACSPTAGRRHRTRRCGHWGNSARRHGTVAQAPSILSTLLQCKAYQPESVHIELALPAAAVSGDPTRGVEPHTRGGHRGYRGGRGTGSGRGQSESGQAQSTGRALL